MGRYYVPAYSDLREHPKTFDLMDRTGWDRATTVGRLVFLWIWALDPDRGSDADGDTSRLTDYGLACVLDLPNPSRETGAGARKALVAAHWIDANGHLHDWEKYAGPFVAERARSRERWKRFRAAREAKTATQRQRRGRTAGEPRDNRGSAAAEPRENRGSNAVVPRDNRPYLDPKPYPDPYPDPSLKESAIGQAPKAPDRPPAHPLVEPFQRDEAPWGGPLPGATEEQESPLVALLAEYRLSGGPSSDQAFRKWIGVALARGVTPAQVSGYMREHRNREATEIYRALVSQDPEAPKVKPGNGRKAERRPSIDDFTSAAREAYVAWCVASGQDARDDHLLGLELKSFRDQGEAAFVAKRREAIEKLKEHAN